jgi:serine/threonine protein kinase
MIGERIGNYRMVRIIGDGGTSTVYEAVHEDIGRRAAVKVLHSSLTTDPELVRRFFQEARAVNIIQHPGIVGVLECGQLADSTTYIVMEYLEGESLAERLARYSGSLPLAEALRFSRQLASALSVAHQKGIVHRDVKPSNIMIVADAEAFAGERTKILDFGLAKLSAENVSESKRLELTRPGTVMGTVKQDRAQRREWLQQTGCSGAS